MICAFFCAFFCGMTCGPGRKKAQKKSTKNHGDLDNFFENLGWGAGSDEVGSRERQGEEPGAMGGEPEARVEQGARANLDLALILQPV